MRKKTASRHKGSAGRNSLMGRRVLLALGDLAGTGRGGAGGCPVSRDPARRQPQTPPPKEPACMCAPAHPRSESFICCFSDKRDGDLQQVMGGVSPACRCLHSHFLPWSMCWCHGTTAAQHHPRAQAAVRSKGFVCERREATSRRNEHPWVPGARGRGRKRAWDGTGLRPRPAFVHGVGPGQCHAACTRVVWLWCGTGGG